MQGDDEGSETTGLVADTPSTRKSRRSLNGDDLLESRSAEMSSSKTISTTAIAMQVLETDGMDIDADVLEASKKTPKNVKNGKSSLQPAENTVENGTGDDDDRSTPEVATPPPLPTKPDPTVDVIVHQPITVLEVLAFADAVGGDKQIQLALGR